MSGSGPAVPVRSLVASSWTIGTAIFRGIRDAGSWFALLVLGAAELAFRNPDDKQAVLDVLAQVAVATGSAGIGARIGRAQADALVRARLLPLFKQSNRAGEGLVRLRTEVDYARVDLANRGTSSIPSKDAEAHLRAVAIRIDEQGADRAGTIEDWRRLLPEDVTEFERGRKEMQR